MKELKNIPKKYEWILNKFIEKNRTYYEFEVWKVGDPTKSLAHFQKPTLQKIEKSIKTIIKKL